jgi:hypothetical protein
LRARQRRNGARRNEHSSNGWASDSANRANLRHLSSESGGREVGQARQSPSGRRTAGLQRGIHGPRPADLPGTKQPGTDAHDPWAPNSSGGRLDLEDEALAETGNIILNSWLATIANLLKQSLKMSLPTVMRRDQRHIFESVVIGESVVLFLHVKFEVSEQAIQGYVALIMDLPSIEQLRALIAAFLTRLG